MKTLLSIFFVVFFILFSQVKAQQILVISGGGARGAWGGGVAESLYKEQGKAYGIVIGTSTGSLLAPFIVSKDFETLRETYTNVGQKDIFSVNPFKKTGEVKKLSALFRLILGKKTLGESKKLRKLIDEKIPMEVYNQMLDDGTFIVTVVNFVTGNIHYYSAQDFDPDVIDCGGMEGKELKRCNDRKEAVRGQMLDWVWASGNQPVLMSLYETKDDETGIKDYWVDGGIRENVALLQGLKLLLELDDDLDNDTLDVIINNTKEPHISQLTKPRIINSLFQTIDIFSYDARYNDVRIPGRMEIPSVPAISDMLPQYLMKDEEDIEPKDNLVIINLYFMNEDTYSVLPKSLLFKKPEMTKLWELGQKYQQSGIVETHPISREYAEYLVQTEFLKEEDIRMKSGR